MGNSCSSCFKKPKSEIEIKYKQAIKKLKRQKRSSSTSQCCGIRLKSHYKARKLNSADASFMGFQSKGDFQNLEEYEEFDERQQFNSLEKQQIAQLKQKSLHNQGAEPIQTERRKVFVNKICYKKNQDQSNQEGGAFQIPKSRSRIMLPNQQIEHNLISEREITKLKQDQVPQNQFEMTFDKKQEESKQTSQRNQKDGQMLIPSQTSSSNSSQSLTKNQNSKIANNQRPESGFQKFLDNEECMNIVENPEMCKYENSAAFETSKEKLYQDLCKAIPLCRDLQYVCSQKGLEKIKKCQQIKNYESSKYQQQRDKCKLQRNQLTQPGWSINEYCPLMERRDLPQEQVIICKEILDKNPNQYKNSEVQKYQSQESPFYMGNYKSRLKEPTLQSQLSLNPISRIHSFYDEKSLMGESGCSAYKSLKNQSSNKVSLNYREDSFQTCQNFSQGSFLNSQYEDQFKSARSEY